MSKALSVDLRERVVAAVAAGASCRAAAARIEAHAALILGLIEQRPDIMTFPPLIGPEPMFG